ncbi:hypothetical protein TRFO_40602 [Tritrichomonas foetus]|uniref:Leucine Rich Repeat family protein n=1 Tax=Tritrichomonas foetus TaxID=1144522 RepID=A0A1J4J618_9EUKA|nr:hypothetical protein TRFO_40602 [Tritrichomonas foetus]|eukprot:OHS93099.1 hypothetical protein TRFO_40602 [Tritrichomonas foetus]
MFELRDLYLQNCESATLEPKQEFLNEIEECISNGRATLDLDIDGGITYNKLEDKDFSVILDTLKKGGCIHSICVPRNNLTDIILPGISQLIVQSDSITRIDLSANQITADGIKALQDALVQSQSLTHVSFSQNDLGDEGCMQVILALRVNRTITHVNLSDTGMSHNALTVIGALIGQINRLKCLHVDNPHNGIDGDSAAKRLFISLSSNESLTELSIARAKLGDDSAFLISNALSVNTVLTNLRLRANGISSVGGEYLAKALKDNHSLEVLDISGNKLSDKGAQAFAQMFTENKKLQKIDMSSNGISGVGLLSICKALPQNNTITDLCLWGNRFVDNSVMAAWAQLMKGPKGQSLMIDFEVHFTDDLPYLARTPVDSSPTVWF